MADFPRSNRGQIIWSVLIRFRGENLSPAEVARRLGYSEASFKARVLSVGLEQALSRPRMSTAAAGRLGSGHWRRRYHSP